MKNYRYINNSKYNLLIFLIGLLIVTGCKDDDPSILSAGNKIITFKFTVVSNSILEQDIEMEIDQFTRTISAAVPGDLMNADFKPIISISADASISPTNETPQNFSSPVVYTVTARRL